MSRLWTEGTGIGLPPLTSITEGLRATLVQSLRSRA